MLYLKQSTSLQSILLGVFIDETDGITARSDLSIANTDIKLSKNGGNMVSKNAGGGTHDESGWYQITLDATDTNMVGRLQISCHVSGALPVFMEMQILEESIYDALFGNNAAGFDANQRVDIGNWLGTAVTLGSGAPDVNIQSTDDIDLSATQKASVNTEVDNALTVTTYAEPGQGAPAATASLKDKISYLYKFMRNKITTTNTAISVRDDGDTQNDQQASIADNGTTFTRGKFGSG